MEPENLNAEAMEEIESCMVYVGKVADTMECDIADDGSVWHGLTMICPPETITEKSFKAQPPTNED